MNKTLITIVLTAALSGCATNSLPLDAATVTSAGRLNAQTGTPVNELALKQIEWNDPAPELQNVAAYKDVKAAMIAFWACYISREWERCYQLETPGVRKAITLEFYTALWSGAPKVKKITLSNFKQLADNKYEVSAVVWVERSKSLSKDASDHAYVKYEWHFIPEENAWRRDYRDLHFRP